jgi:epoxide hydrolase A/B
MTSLPEPVRIKSNDIELAVRLGGPEDGIPLLLIHGWPELSYSWKSIWDHVVAAGFRVIAPDLKGFGDSDAPDDVAQYGIDEMTEDLTGLLDTLGIEKAVWCGHDWGGIIMWQAACLKPERFLGAIGVNTPHLPRPSTPPSDAFLAMGGEDHYILQFQSEAIVREAFEGREADFFDYIFAPPPPASMLDKLFPGVTHIIKNFAKHPGRSDAELVVGPADRAVYVEAYAKTGPVTPTHIYRNFDRNWERMGGVDHRLKMPCLMIGADADFMLPPMLMQWMPALCSDLETHVLEGCGHWTMWEKPGELAAFIEEWVARRFG